MSGRAPPIAFSTSVEFTHGGVSGLMPPVTGSPTLKSGSSIPGAPTWAMGSGPALLRAKREPKARRRIWVMWRCIFALI